MKCELKMEQIKRFSDHGNKNVWRAMKKLFRGSAFFSIHNQTVKVAVPGTAEIYNRRKNMINLVFISAVRDNGRWTHENNGIRFKA